MDTATFNNIYKRANERVHHFVFKEGYRQKDLGLSLRQSFLIFLSIRDFKKCLNQIPNHWPSMFLLGKIYQRKGDFKTALFWFESAFNLEKNNIDVVREASLSSVHVDNIDKAIYYSAEALKIKPNDFSLLGNHALNLLIGNRDLEAKDMIDKAIEISPDSQINKNIKLVIDSVMSGKMKRLTCKDAVK